MYLGFTKKLSFKTIAINIRITKIDDFKLNIFEIVIAFLSGKQREKILTL